MKDGAREFPPYNETVQRAWTAYKLVTGDTDHNSPRFWLHWVQRAELNTQTLFLARKRRFPESGEEYEDEASGELIVQAKSKCRERGYDLTWTREDGFVLRHPSGALITLEGPVPT